MPTSRPSSRGKQIAIKLLRLALALYLGVFLALTLLQRTLMYFPERGTESHLLALAPQYKVQPWRDGRGSLIGWKREGSIPAPHRMLILHGNGGNALELSYFMDGLGALGGGKLWDFYSLEYPGYGSRQGSANQTEIVAAANDAVNELLKSDARPLFITGQSLGTGVACLVAAAHPCQVRGLFLVAPYTSTADVAASRYWMFPVRLVMQDKYEAAKALKSYTGRVAVLLAGVDDIVPTRFGQALFDGYAGPKQLWLQPGSGHNSLNFNPHAGWWRGVSDFLLGGHEDVR